MKKIITIPNKEIRVADIKDWRELVAVFENFFLRKQKVSEYEKDYNVACFIKHLTGGVYNQPGKKIAVKYQLTNGNNLFVYRIEDTWTFRNYREESELEVEAVNHGHFEYDEHGNMTEVLDNEEV